MKRIYLLALLFANPLLAQIAPPRISAADRSITENQAGDIFKALRAVGFEAKKVVYPIYVGRQRVAFGISIGGERILTKASEVTNLPSLFTLNRKQEPLVAELVGVYPDNDLAVLKVPGLQASAAKWADAGTLEEGSFLAAIRADGEAKALGVLSVRERSLKAGDQGFLGIQMDPREAGEGVRVDRVVKGSAAAEVGLRRGDVIIKIQGDDVGGFYELSTRLRRLRSGEEPEIEFIRNGKNLKVKPKLKGREPDRGLSRRLERMDRMSGTRSQVRGDFGNVLQSDMELEATDAGLPVVDLDGRIIGMVIARAGRISTLILPGDDLIEILKGNPEPLEAQPKVAGREEWPQGGRRARMQRELEMMRKMMENLQRELDEE